MPIIEFDRAEFDKAILKLEENIEFFKKIADANGDYDKIEAIIRAEVDNHPQ